jgi:hypothetical protein
MRQFRTRLDRLWNKCGKISKIWSRVEHGGAKGEKLGKVLQVRGSGATCGKIRTDSQLIGKGGTRWGKLWKRCDKIGKYGAIPDEYTFKRVKRGSGSFTLCPDPNIIVLTYLQRDRQPWRIQRQNLLEKFH